jgi:hypothetical protein
MRDGTLGVNGERALKAERDQRRQLERRVAHLKRSLLRIAADLQELATENDETPTPRRRKRKWWGR